MHFNLIHCIFIKRYKRFFVDVCLDNGDIVTAHCPNTGSMYSLLNEGVHAWVEPNDNPKRKLKYTLCLLELPNRGRALVNTMWPNRIVEEAIIAGRIPSLDGYRTIQREKKYGIDGKSRIDIFLSDHPTREGNCYVEVKNVTMLSDTNARQAAFPDSVTERGSKHLRELMACRAAPADDPNFSPASPARRCVQFYLMSRTDCTHMILDAERDPVYASTAAEAQAAGVEFLAYDCIISSTTIHIDAPIPCSV